MTVQSISSPARQYSVRPQGLVFGLPHLRAASSVVEHLTFNQGVPGSIPGRPTTLRSRELRRGVSFGSASHATGVELRRSVSFWWRATQQAASHAEA